MYFLLTLKFFWLPLTIFYTLTLLRFAHKFSDLEKENNIYFDTRKQYKQ